MTEYRDKPVGGFFGLEPPLKPTPGNVLALWQVPRRHHAFFANGRSALHHLLRWREPKRLWLPAYCCDSLAKATAGLPLEVRFFPITESLSPDTAFLGRMLKTGDAILGIDYFGRAPSREFAAFARARRDLLWIEDRAQALHTAAPAWGEVTLYSPRKLLGVPDGGVLVSRSKPFPDSKPQSRNQPDFALAALLRYEDATQEHNAVWYEAYATQEQRMRVTAEGMSRLARGILLATEAAPLIKKRQQNYEFLQQQLGDYAVLPRKRPKFAPFGYPIRVRDRRMMLDFLHRSKLFAAHHWPRIPSPAAEFPFEHGLSRDIVTLPVDHRYGLEDMRHIVGLVRRGNI